MMRTKRTVRETPARGMHAWAMLGLLLLAVLALGSGGCARRADTVPAFTATATATVNPQLPPADARREANSRAETQAREQILNQAGQLRLADGRTLEDVAAADATLRAELYDTVRASHITSRNVTPEGVFTVTLSLDKVLVQRIIDGYQRRGGK